MLHHSNFIIVFFTIMFASLFLVFIRTDAMTNASKQNIEYGRKLTAASHSAMQSLEPQQVMSGRYIWSNEDDRRKSINSFYYSLSQSFLKSTLDNNIQVTTPIILLIDTDGYYIGYNALFNSENMVDPDKINEFQNGLQLTGLNTWGEEYPLGSQYYIRYYLNDNVKVTTPEGKIYEGNRHAVAETLFSKGADSDLVYYLDGSDVLLKDAGPMHTDYIGEKFEVQKTDLIVNKTQETLNTYINQYNYNAGVNAGGYNINMPNISGEMWHRLLENPTIISFMQGHNINTGKEIVNTYAYSGGEILKGDKYFITDVGLSKKYHSMRECLKTADLTSNGDGTYTFDDGSGAGPIKVEKIYFTMQDCADQGASPCPVCIK